jgi:secernin
MLIGCDTMVALPEMTAGGQTLFAKNSDRPANECQPLVLRERQTHPPGAATGCQFVAVPQAGEERSDGGRAPGETLRHVGSRPYWCWGYEHGFNECQVVIGNEALPSPLEFSEPKLIGMELLRLGLERGRSAAEAVEVITGLVTRYGQGRFANEAGVGTYDNGFLVADPREAFVLETAGHAWAVRRVTASAGISNVYSIGTDWDRLSADAEALATRQGWWQPGGRFDFAAAYTRPEARANGLSSGARRRARSCAVLAQRAGAIDAATMMALLRDHSDGTQPDEPFRTDLDHRGGLCMHDNPDGTGGNTAASLVAALCADGSRLPIYWCSFYSPCLGIFLPIFLEGDLPPVLGIGGAAPDADSPWWLFHRLSHLARREPETGIPAVRARWAGLQTEFMASAERIAREGRHLWDRGDETAARQMLTEYMARNVEGVLQTVREMIGEIEAIIEQN